uniref:Cytochrome c oxidase subunit 2 n=1 Tax=Pedicinus obtusus TaxID=592408 RepID=A0A7L9CWH2_9NEOP|nr:cytochrome c oxidase subunit 2 [Pedicinus obtusus]
MPLWGQLSLQDSCTPLSYFISNIHDTLMVVCLGVFVLVTYLICNIIMQTKWDSFLTEAEILETFWVLIPTMLLFALVAPSLHCLYLMDEVYSPWMSVKVMGHQWYWSYEYGDWSSIEFDSYMLTPDGADALTSRLLEVDNPLVIPYKTEIRMIISSSDVLHAWSLPCAGVKMDAVPGRLNHSMIYCEKIGLMYGQCSEMCGTLHSFMPICVQTMLKPHFIKWVEKAL